MTMQPFPPAKPFEIRTSGTLDVATRISTARGWLEINVWPYELHSESFAETQRQMRRTQASNPFVAGTFTVNAVPDNVTEMIGVWVTGDSHYETEMHAAVLIESFEQVSYLIERRIEDSLVTWYCFAADVQMTTQLEHRHAKMTLVQAQIPRLPSEERSLA